MKMSLALRDSVLALMEEYQRQEGAKGNPLSDSAVSKKAMNYGDFVGILRRWDGGPKSPTLENVAKFEQFLRDQMGEEQYQRFVEDRARAALPPVEF